MHQVHYVDHASVVRQILKGYFVFNANLHFCCFAQHLRLMSAWSLITNLKLCICVIIN